MHTVSAENFVCSALLGCPSIKFNHMLIDYAIPLCIAKETGFDIHAKALPINNAPQKSTRPVPEWDILYEKWAVLGELLIIQSMAAKKDTFCGLCIAGHTGGHPNTGGVVGNCRSTKVSQQRNETVFC